MSFRMAANCTNKRKHFFEVADNFRFMGLYASICSEKFIHLLWFWTSTEMEIQIMIAIMMVHIFRESIHSIEDIYFMLIIQVYMKMCKIKKR